MISLVSETYNGSPVSFRAADGWVNATQMARPFGKRPNDFLALASTRVFIGALESDTGVSGNTFETVRGAHADGRPQGTWMHPDLALEFARWLSPEFAIWTNRVIRKVLSGQSLDDSVPQAISEKLSHAIDMVAALAEAHVRLERRVSDIEEYLTRQRRELTAGGFPTGRKDEHPATLILAVLAEGPFSIWQLSHRLGWKRRTIERKLHQLRCEGKIAWSGKGFALAPAKEVAP